jgi:hypothetical protein
MTSAAGVVGIAASSVPALRVQTPLGVSPVTGRLTLPVTPGVQLLAQQSQGVAQASVIVSQSTVMSRLVQSSGVVASPPVTPSLSNG